MQGKNVFHHEASFCYGRYINGHRDYGILSPPDFKKQARFCAPKMKASHTNKIIGLKLQKSWHASRCVGDSTRTELDLWNEEEEVCPVECVKEFRSDEEFRRILEKARRSDSLVVVDFFKTSCGSCKYIEKGFAKLCRGAGEQAAPVIFLKHNVLDEYDEPSEFAERLRVKVVPLFQFYKNGALMESFASRDKDRILAAILKYASSPVF